ncbi:MAG: OmpA family protein, partial [Planctomycetes bacterium]|nr:OmpA family protein [Planctomycetota bacterium]
MMTRSPSRYAMVPSPSPAAPAPPAAPPRVSTPPPPAPPPRPPPSPVPPATNAAPQLSGATMVVISSTRSVARSIRPPVSSPVVPP